MQVNKLLTGVKKFLNYFVKITKLFLFIVLPEFIGIKFNFCNKFLNRTGIISYIILRMFNYNSEEAKAKLKELREATYKGVKQWRLDLAELIVLKANLINFFELY